MIDEISALNDLKHRLAKEKRMRDAQPEAGLHRCPMTTPPQPQQDCDHQCVCLYYVDIGPCTDPDIPLLPCENDTRSCPAPSSQPIDKRVPYVECNHSYSSCPINWDAHNKAIRNATLDELHKSFKVSKLTGNETDFELGFRQGMTHAQCTIKSLRTQSTPKEQQR